MSAADAAAGLRELADWIDEHPDLACEIERAEVVAYPADTTENVARWARSLGHAEKEYVDNLFRLNRAFGPVKLTAVFWRETVCEKVITKREVTREIPDPLFIVPTVTVTETIEELEWVCAPILAAEVNS